jgi:hypothetical protein
LDVVDAQEQRAEVGEAADQRREGQRDCVRTRRLSTPQQGRGQGGGLQCRQPRDLLVGDVVAEVDQRLTDEPLLRQRRLGAQYAAVLLVSPRDQFPPDVGLADSGRALEHQGLRAGADGVQPRDEGCRRGHPRPPGHHVARTTVPYGLAGA